MSEDEAKDLILNKARLTGWAGLSDYDIETIEAKWPDLFEEDVRVNTMWRPINCHTLPQKRHFRALGTFGETKISQEYSKLPLFLRCGSDREKFSSMISSLL